MTSIETILKGLEGSVTEFKRCCEVRVCLGRLSEHLDNGLAHGRFAIQQLRQIVMDHLENIKGLLEKNDEE